jgi:hypothetical protein
MSSYKHGFGGAMFGIVRNVRNVEKIKNNIKWLVAAVCAVLFGMF